MEFYHFTVEEAKEYIKAQKCFYHQERNEDLYRACLEIIRLNDELNNDTGVE